MSCKQIILLGALAAATPVSLMAEGLAHGDAAPGNAPLVIAAEDNMPLSRDALFGLEPPDGHKGDTMPGEEKSGLPASKDDLFDLAPAQEPSTAPMAGETPKATDLAALPASPPTQSPSLRGFFQTELARTYAQPDHWSKFTGRLQLGTQGRLQNGVQWKVSGRVDYNAVFEITSFYPAAVRDDQRAEFSLRENYLDFAAGGWDWRLGRQHIVWGEMVGLFFADVVSAKDMREFVLQDFQLMRIPQWAARAEYFKDDFHAELIWIPFPSYDEVGKPGAEYFAYPATPTGFIPVVLGEEKPSNSLDHTNLGLRLSQLTNGWDISGFLYSSMDSSPTAYVVNKVGPTYQYQLRHDRIYQVGGTLAKDLGSFVLKGEAIYTQGRHYNVTDPADADGVVKQNTVDWVVGLDFNPSADTRLNTQFFQRIYFNHDPSIIPDRLENGFTVLANHKFPHNLEAEVLWVRSLNRDDWMLRPKVTWGFERNWRLSFGLDIFDGPLTGIFGQFDDTDRVYTEVRYDF